MHTVEEFLAHAIQLEMEAANRFDQLADAMGSSGNMAVAKLFRRLGDYSRLHLADARERSGFRDIPKLKPNDFDWPGAESPESAAIWATDPLIGPEEALETALAAEQAGLDYYAGVLAATSDPEITVFAKEFVAEEESHVVELRRWITALRHGEAMPAES